MTDLKKNPGTWGSTARPFVAYKPSWSEKVGPATPDLHQRARAKRGRRSCGGCQ